MSDKDIKSLELSPQSHKYLTTLKSRFDSPDILEKSNEIAIAAQSIEDLSLYIDSIDTSKDFESALLRSQASFSAVAKPSDIPIDLWSTNAVHYIGHLMAISGRNRAGEVKLKSSNYHPALQTFIREHINANMDYDGVLSSLLNDFNRLAENGYSKIVKLVLFDLVLTAVKTDKGLDLGHKHAWHSLLKTHAINLRDGFNDSNEGWLYANEQHLDEIDLDQISSYVPLEDRDFEEISLSVDQLDKLMDSEEFLPEHSHTANRLLRNMILVEGYSKLVALELVNFLSKEHTRVNRLIKSGKFTKSKKVITVQVSKIFQEELESNLKSMEIGPLNLAVWSRIQEILQGRYEPKQKRNLNRKAKKSSRSRIAFESTGKQAVSTHEIDDFTVGDYFDVLNG